MAPLDRFFQVPDDDVQYITERPPSRRPRSLSSASTCTLGRGDERTFDEITVEEVVDLTIDDTLTSRQPLEAGELALASLRLAEEILQPNDCIEVREVSIGSYNVDFITIKIIARERSGKITIRGTPLTRNRGLANKLPKKLNEVCQILHMTDDNRPALVSISTNLVVKKRTIIFTNAQWPKHCSTQFGSLPGEQRRLANESLGILVCRWSFKIYSVTQGRKSKPVEEVLERIHAEEVTDPQYRESPENLCFQWRGGRALGGSWSSARPHQSPIETIELDSSQTNASRQRHRHRDAGQKYTLFDSFAGAGGVSRGVQMTRGFTVTHAVDKAADVWPTYQANFRDTELFKGSVDEFIKRSHKRHLRVDFLHLSPPCQYFSPAHTHQSVHDDENIFALFSCNSLINKVRPRIITVEQTFGITHERHQEYLRILINDFTQFGYSVRWKVVRLCTWGSSQDRKRLIMIAAAPGERLPPFPEPTHSESGAGGLKPYTTIRQALSGIRLNDELHDLNTVKHYHPRRPAYDPNGLAGTLTTGGADFAYPDGTRDFTLREYASLQGFPCYHRFKGTRTSIKKQIGNAFPPNTVRVLYDHLQKWLLREDGFSPYQEAVPDAIMVEEDNNMVIVDESDGSSSSVARGSPNEWHSQSPEMEDFVEILDPMDIDGVSRYPQGRNESHYDSDKVMIDLT